MAWVSIDWVRPPFVPAVPIWLLSTRNGQNVIVDKMRSLQTDNEAALDHLRSLPFVRKLGDLRRFTRDVSPLLQPEIPRIQPMHPRIRALGLLQVLLVRRQLLGRPDREVHTAGHVLRFHTHPRQHSGI
jgi:hypothetical protein